MAIFGQTRYRTPLDVVLVILAGVALDRLARRAPALLGAERALVPSRHEIAERCLHRPVKGRIGVDHPPQLVARGPRRGRPG